MAFAHRILPDHFLPSDWDQAWALGWFRMRQSLFTTHFLEFGRQFFSAVWLRVGLGALEGDKAFQSLKKRNSRFRVEFGPWEVHSRSAHEDLYRRYRESLAFEPAPSLADLLVGDESRDRFPTHRVDLWDGEVLVASGIFDLGERAAAGISCFYDPAYKKYSLGKYLIYLKMAFCRDRGCQWFYPGYVVPGNPRFDYKWDIGTSAIQYLDLGTGAWVPFNPSLPVPDPLAAMEAQLADLLALWEGRELRPQLRYYLALDINLNPHVRGMDLFDYPVFLDVLAREGVPVLAIVNDPRDGLYHLVHCRSLYRFETSAGDEAVFDSDLLAVDRVLFSTADPRDMVLCLAEVAEAVVRRD